VQRQAEGRVLFLHRRQFRADVVCRERQSRASQYLGLQPSVTVAPRRGPPVLPGDQRKAGPPVEPVPQCEARTLCGQAERCAARHTSGDGSQQTRNRRGIRFGVAFANVARADERWGRYGFDVNQPAVLVENARLDRRAAEIGADGPWPGGAQRTGASRPEPLRASTSARRRDSSQPRRSPAMRATCCSVS